MDARKGDVPPYVNKTQVAEGRSRTPVLRQFLMVVLPFVVLAGAVAGFMYMYATRSIVPVDRPAERVRTVEAVVAQPEAVRANLVLYGQIGAGRSVDLRALVAGKVIEVSPDLLEGGHVAEGEALLRIDPFAFEGAVVRARADLDEARARIAEIEARVNQEQAALVRAREQAEISERELRRLIRLAETGTTPERAVDEARTRHSQALQAVETRENQLLIFESQRRQLEAAIARLEFALRQAERDLDDTVLRAPFDSIVSNPDAEVGKLVGVNDRIATLIATDRLEARFSLSDSQYGRLVQAGDLEGREVDVIWRAGETTITRRAMVARVAANAGEAGFTVHATFVENGGTFDVLRPGAFIEVRMQDVPRPDAIILPGSALYNGSVYVIEDSRLRQVAVDVLAFSEEGVIVRGDIPAGVRVLASRLTAPATGQRVEVRP